MWLTSTDLDLHCLLRQGMSCSAREGLKFLHIQILYHILLLTFEQAHFISCGYV